MSQGKKNKRDFWKDDLWKVTTPDTIKRVIQQGGKTLVEAAEKLGKEFQVGGLTTNQIRNVYGMVKQMEMQGFDLNRFILLKPKLAYAEARAGVKGAFQFKEVMTCAIEEVVESDDSERHKEKFARFIDFFEAILAYHKAADGR